MRRLRPLVAASMMICGSAYAQTVTFTPSSTTVLPGDTFTVDVDYTGNPANPIAGYDFDISYTDTAFDPTIPADCNSAIAGTTSCSVDGENDTDEAGDVINIIAADATAFSDGLLAQFTVTVPLTATPGAYSFSQTGTSTATDDTGTDYGVDPTTYVPANVTVAAGPTPDIEFYENDGTEDDVLTITADLNSATNSANAELQNDGTADATNVTCSEGDPADEISFTSVPTGTIAAGGTDAFTASCDTSAAGAFSDTLTCSDDSGDSDILTVNCTVTAQPASPSASNAQIVADLGQTGNATVVVIDAEPASLGFTITGCTLDTADDPGDDNDGNFSVVIDDATVAPGDNGQLTVTGVAPANGTTATNSLTCTTDVAGTFAVALTATGVIPVVPTLSQWALILLAMVLAGFGAYQVRRRSGLVA